MGRRDVERRLETARELLRGHHAGVEPPSGFVERVVAELPDRDADALAMGWAAARLLPVTMALLLMLGWMTWARPEAHPGEPALETATDVLAWILDPDEGDS